MGRRAKKKIKQKNQRKVFTCPNCGQPGPHYVPPCLGDPGFYTCISTREKPKEASGPARTRLELIDTARWIDIQRDNLEYHALQESSEGRAETLQIMKELLLQKQGILNQLRRLEEGDNK